MKKLIVLCGEQCGYCKKAKMLMKRALEKEPRYIALDIQFITEQEGMAGALAHTLVPAFFCGNQLVFEGNPDMDRIMQLLRQCYE